MQQEKIGFIDEYGDKSLQYEQEGVSTYFIVTAIILDKDKVKEVEQELLLIKKRLQVGAELKSKNFPARMYPKRLALLKEIAKLDIMIYSVAVDKRKVFEDSGLRFKEPFFKYLNGLLDAELYRYYPYLELVSDEHGGEKFMEGFTDYVKKRHFNPEFFRKPEFRFGDSRKEVLIQAADFISGSLARVLDPKKRVEKSEEIIDILKPKMLHLREWPETPLPYAKAVGAKDLGYNNKIADFSLNLINDYIARHARTNDETVANQLICLNYLLFRFKADPFEYVYTDEILERLSQRNETVKSKQIFRGEIIARLRDQGILLVSSHNGYKIPCSHADLINYFNRYNQLIMPMLQRLNRTNRLVKIATDNELDLLAQKEFTHLARMVKLLYSKAEPVA